MTISSNNLDVSRFGGMKENETSIDENILLDLSKGKKVSETDNLGFFDANKIPSREYSIRMHDQTHPVTNDNIQHAAQPGKGGFLRAIKNFFLGLFQPMLQMPKTVRVTVAGKEINVNGERFRGMIEALPKGERDEALGDLRNQITSRLRTGENLLKSALAGQQMLNVSTQAVSDMMLFIQLRHVALHPKESFTNGAYSIEDPNGHLARFLDNCNEGYYRTSSHLKGLQSDPLGPNERDAMRGIDIPGGVGTGLLDKRGTILYGSIPQQNNVQGSTRRLFIMTERHGCRFWTKSFWVNNSIRPHRSIRFSDIGSAIKHVCNFLEKSDEKSGINYRSEKLPGLHPKEIVKTLGRLSICQKQVFLISFFRKEGKDSLPENARLFKTLEWLNSLENAASRDEVNYGTHLRRGGRKSTLIRADKKYAELYATMDSIKSTLIQSLYIDIPNNRNRNTPQTFSWFLSFAGLKHPDRLGNEVMMSLNDLQGLNQNIQQPENHQEEGNMMLNESYDSSSDIMLNESYDSSSGGAIIHEENSDEFSQS